MSKRKNRASRYFRSKISLAQLGSRFLYSLFDKAFCFPRYGTSALSAKDQEKALKHVETIAKLGKNPKNQELLEQVGDALDALPTVVKRGAGLLEFAEKHLPTITGGIRTILAAWGITI